MKALKIITLTFMFVMLVVLGIIAFAAGSGLLLLIAIAGFFIGCFMSVIVALKMIKNGDCKSSDFFSAIIALKLLKNNSHSKRGRDKK